MAFKITILESALNELEDAIEWYGKISPELSEDIINKFLSSVNLILEKPLQNPELRNGYRKINLDRFPYKLVYKIFQEEILVVAFAHHKRRPQYWLKR